MRATMVASHGIYCLDIYPVASCLLSVTCCVAPRGKVPMQREALSSSFRPWSSGPAAKAQVQPTGHLASPETRRLGASPADDEPRQARPRFCWAGSMISPTSSTGPGLARSPPGQVRSEPARPTHRSESQLASSHRDNSSDREPGAARSWPSRSRRMAQNDVERWEHETGNRQRMHTSPVVLTADSTAGKSAGSMKKLT